MRANLTRLTTCMSQPSSDGRALATLFFRLARALKPASTGDPVEGPVLVVLHQLASTGPTRLSDLAGALGLDASTVSRHVRALEAAGYLTRTEHPADRRAALLSVSPAGSAACEAAVTRRAARLDTALAGWSATDRQALTTLLDRLASDLAAAPAAGPYPMQESA